jgi:pimeloyl-ACP methyl ester carboxylesterase
MALLARVAPAAAERQAVRLFLTPMRRPVRRPDLRRAMNVIAPWHDAPVEQRELTLHLNGGALRAWRWGAGPRVLLVHGWSGDAADMAPIAAAFVRAGYEAVLVDMPAHGASSGRQTSLVEWMWVIRAVVQAVGPCEAVVGHSFGGAAVALAMGELGIDTRAAVLVAPAGSPWDFVHRFADTVGLPAERSAGMVTRLAARVGRSPQSLDPRRAAESIDVPALVVHDPADDEVPWSHGEALALAWRDARLLDRPGTGHRRILRDGATIASIVEFVRGLVGREADGEVVGLRA